MPSAEGDLRAFQVNSVGAFTGFLALLVQALLRMYRKRKSQAGVGSPVMLSAVSCGEEPPELNVLHDGPPGPGDAQPDEDGDKILHDRIQALLFCASSPTGDTTTEIARAAAVYLQAAESLLRLRHGEGPYSTGDRMNRVELHAAAREVIRDAAGITASLLPPAPPDRGSRAKRGASWAVSMSVTGLMGALMAAKEAEYKVFGDQRVDLTRFTLLGEPRAAAGLQSQVTADALSAAGRAFVDSTRTALRLVIPIAMVPLYAAFNCLVSVLLPVGLPLDIFTVFIISLLAIFMMIPLAFGNDDKDAPEDEWDDVDEQE